MAPPARTSRSQVARDASGDEPFRVFVESVRDYALLILDLEGHITTWNKGAEAIKGWKADEVIGKHFSIFYPPEAILDGLPARELVGAARDGRYEDEGWRIRKDGTRFWANVIITALRDSSDTLIGYAKVTRDLTERRRHEEYLRHSEMRFRTLVESVRDYAIFMLDTQGTVATWNAGAEQIMGYEAREILGEPLSRFYPNDGRERELANKELETATLEGRFEDEGWRLRKDGSKFWASVVLTAIRDANGTLMGFTKITRDLSERRKHESIVRESEERFRLLVESVVDYAIITVDADGFINSWNSGAQRITSYSSAEVMGKHFSRLYTPEDVAANKPWQQLLRATEGARVNDESWRVRRDGSQYWANSVIARLPDRESGSNNYYIVIQDLTQRRHAESLADTAQKMHEFIAMLAHELRNPLAPIRNAVALMQRRKVDDPIIDSMRQTIERQSNQLTRIIDELLDVNRVARGQLTIEKQTVDLRDIVNRAVETSRPLIDAKEHELHLSLPEEPVVVHADPLRLQQVVVNLLNNAAKYTPTRGRVQLTVATDDGHAVVRVCDNGKGIERDALERVFDLFIQLEPNGGNALGGLGVGLALVRRIVELHGGRVQALSDGLGRGAEFVVRIPRSDDPLQISAGEPRPDVAMSASMRVMVVDDNVDAADSLALMLQQLGLDVRAVYDGSSALRIFDAFRPHLVLMDIGMPQMNGYEVARAMRNLGGGMKCMLAAVTGWGQDSDRARAKEAGFDRHCTKPLSDDTLRELLAEAAARHGLNSALR